MIQWPLWAVDEAIPSDIGDRGSDTGPKLRGCTRFVQAIHAVHNLHNGWEIDAVIHEDGGEYELWI